MVTGSTYVFDIYGDGTGSFGVLGLDGEADQSEVYALIMANNPGFNPLEDAARYVGEGYYFPCTEP